MTLKQMDPLQPARTTVPQGGGEKGAGGRKLQLCAINCVTSILSHLRDQGGALALSEEKLPRPAWPLQCFLQSLRAIMAGEKI